MTSNNIFQTFETLKNFDDFNNMFKGIDRVDRHLGDTAQMVFEKVKLERNQSRLNDVFRWIENCECYKIKRNIDFSIDEEDIYYDSDSDDGDSGVGDIED